MKRLWAKVRKGGPDECWPWLGTTDKDGYGMIRVGSRTDGSRKMARACRVVFELTRGFVPEHVRHSCHNPPCCNPAHLKDGTHQDNMDDLKFSGRAKNRGQGQRGEHHHSVKLNWAAVASIRSSALSDRALAKKHGVSKSLISQVRLSRIWKEDLLGRLCGDATS